MRLFTGPLGTTGHIHPLLVTGFGALVILTQVLIIFIGFAPMRVPSVRPSLVTGFGAALISVRTLRHISLHWSPVSGLLSLVFGVKRAASAQDFKELCPLASFASQSSG